MANHGPLGKNGPGKANEVIPPALLCTDSHISATDRTLLVTPPYHHESVDQRRLAEPASSAPGLP